MSTDKDERWYVQFDSGDVTLMTLDEIQEAFEAGKIHANTYLIEVGDSEWKTLSVVAGLDDEGGDEEELTPAPQPSAQAAPAAPVAQSAYRAPVPQASYAAAGVQQGYGAQTQTLRGHAPPAQPAQLQRVPSVAAGGWPPVATAAPQSAMPATATRPASISSAPPSYQAPYSMMPVTADLDVGLDARQFKSGKRTALIAALVAIPAIGGGIYGLTKLDAPAAHPPIAAAAAAPAAMPRPNSWSSSASTPTPSTPTPSSDSNSGSASSGSGSDSSGSASTGSSGKLSEDMKKALLANDAERSSKKKAARSTAAPARRSSGKKSGGSDVFKAGGSASDPLNSKL